MAAGTVFRASSYIRTNPYRSLSFFSFSKRTIDADLETSNKFSISRGVISFAICAGSPRHTRKSYVWWRVSWQQNVPFALHAVA